VPHYTARIGRPRLGRCPGIAGVRIVPGRAAFRGKHKPSTIAEIVAHRTAVLNSRNPRLIALHSRRTLRECRRREAHNRGSQRRHSHGNGNEFSHIRVLPFLGKAATRYCTVRATGNADWLEI
jgi:hypothetical protein